MTRLPAMARDRPIRIHAVCSAIVWCCGLNAAWLALSLAGGVVLGVGPATVTASILVRRRGRGDTVRARDFWATWRREFWPGNAVTAPVTAVVALLGYDAGIWRTGPLWLVTVVALAVAIGAGSYVAPMYAFYRLPLRAYPVKALRFALARPVPTVLLLLVFAALSAATAVAPVLAVTVSVGAWLQVSTWLCVRFFTENEDRLADAAQPGPGRPERLLPTEPLRIR